MPSVELRIDVSGFPGHSFLVITGPDGVERGYGLYPAEKGSPSSDGIIKNDIEHPYDRTTGKIDLTNEGYQHLVDYINNSILYPPLYNVYFGSQCADWAVKGLVEAGIPAVDFPNLIPDNILRDLFETIAWNPYTQWLNLMIRDLWNAAQLFVQRRDPLTLDLDGDGIKTVAASATNPILFDHDGDGTKNGTGWIKGDDGFLVLDRNANGTIDSGQELFGDSTPLAGGGTAEDGFAALAQEDTNADGVVNNLDTRWSQLRVCQDLNQDGTSQVGELLTMRAFSTAPLCLFYTA